jgi:hypothetical protein
MDTSQSGFRGYNTYFVNGFLKAGQETYTLPGL